MRDATELGATLYVPATRADLKAIAAGDKLGELRSIIFCTEDAVNEKDLPHALANLRAALAGLRQGHGCMRFVRVRNPAVMRQVLAMPGAERLDGFVLPKVVRDVLPLYMAQLQGTGHCVMPTLETREVFDEAEMQALRRMLADPAIADRVLTLRIGGNDLLALLGMRRPRGKTLYQTPLGPVISRLVTLFKPSGLNLSAPVFEYFNDRETLLREVGEDLDHGLVGKTAVHPEQVPLIEACYRVHVSDLEMAEMILREDAPAVFRMHDSMCEPATHRIWAARLRLSAACFGLRESLTPIVAPIMAPIAGAVSPPYDEHAQQPILMN